MGLIVRSLTISGSSILTLVGLAFSVAAQSTPPPGVTIPPTAPETIEQTLPKPSDPSPSPSESPSISPEPSLQTPVVPPLEEVAPPSSERFLIKTIEVLGSTVLQDQIAALIKPFENQEKTFEDLLALRSDITQLYIENGYITSGAFLLNNQALSSGVVQIQVVEGELEQIEIGGLNRLRPGYVRSRLELATTPPLNRQRLEEALQLLQLDPLIERVNAELTAGSSPGRNILQVSLREAPAFHAGIVTNNNQSPSVGSIETRVFAAHDDLFGFGDRLSASYGITEGLNAYDISYAIPVNARNGTLNFRYGNDNSHIVEAPFEDLGIRSKTRTYSVGFRQPLVRSPRSEFALGFALDLRRSRTFLLDDIPFSFSEGPQNGESKVTVLRFSQDWVDRGVRRVLAARSQFSLGIDAFDATVNETGPDGRFFSWLGQFQWVQQLSPRTLLVARVDAQLTPDALLPLERFSIGGAETLRGYRQNQLVADNGILGSVEVRVPLTSDPRVLQLTPFVEAGTVWNHQGANSDPSAIASVGLGLRWLIGSGFDARLDYGIPLVGVDKPGDSLQDNGLYFSLRYQPF
jgi:hemolysin activation/secretion protein